MGLGATTRRFANTCVDVERETGRWEKGRWITGKPERFDIRANVQPAPPDTIQRLPEGSRRDGARVIFPRAGSRVMRTAEAGDGGHSADLVTIDGERFEIATVEPWRQHKRYVATRFGQ